MGKIAAMQQLADYFDASNESDIRIRGTRVGIETVLFDFLEGTSPEEIALRYRSLTLEQVYATITYYLQQRERLDAYLKTHREAAERDYQRQVDQPSNIVQRLRELKQPVG